MNTTLLNLNFVAGQMAGWNSPDTLHNLITDWGQLTDVVFLLDPVPGQAAQGRGWIERGPGTTILVKTNPPNVRWAYRLVTDTFCETIIGDHGLWQAWAGGRNLQHIQQLQQQLNLVGASFYGQLWQSSQALYGHSLGQSSSAHAGAANQAYPNLAAQYAGYPAVTLASTGAFGPASGVTTISAGLAHSVLTQDFTEDHKIRNDGIVAGEIIAWRCWKNENGWLQSMYISCLWAPNEVMEGDVAHGYGIHAWKKGSGALEYGSGRRDTVIGTIALWGEIVEHETGYRAQYGKIRSLDYMVYPGDEKKLVSIRRRYLGEDGKPPKPISRFRRWLSS